MNKRLPEPYGKWIDRNQEVRFRFEGTQHTGYAGDSISTALWAEGLRVLGRSFKYHRARGVWSLANVDANVMVESATETNMRGDVIALAEGMDVRAVNTAGGVAKDRRRFLGWFSAFTPVGFYYKAFHSPKALFPFYEKRIRDLAGLGKINAKNPIRHTPKDYAFCDVLVIGAGPAGLSAAVAAAEAGAKVMVVDENPHPGGSLNYQHGGAHLDALLEKMAALDNIEYRPNTMATSHDADNWIALVDAERLTKLRACTVVNAAGCYEQPAVFHNNDLSGVMMGSAAQRLMHLFAVQPCQNAAVVVANRDGYRVALDLLEAGVKVVAVADLRAEGESSDLAQQVADKGVTVKKGWCIYEAQAAAGNNGVRGAVLCPLDKSGAPQSSAAETVSCDGIIMSVGWNPADTLLRQANTQMTYDATLEQFVPKTLPDTLFAAGRVNGVYDLEAQLEDGVGAGQAAAAFVGNATSQAERPKRSGTAQSHPYPIFSHPKGKNFVDLDEDLQVQDILNAMQEGFDHIELLKRYATVGMGPSQGRHSNLAALRILTKAKGETMADTCVSTARPYASPVPMSHLAGRIFTVRRHTPTHFWHETEAKAKLMYAGAWYRPEYYEKSGLNREECIYEEAKNVREKAGLIDLGTLGKLEVSGPDAVPFLERMYTGKFTKLKVNMCRYAVMCDESGIVIDDGITARLAEDRFYVSTTTGGAEGVFRNMKRWAMQWGMTVTIVNATDHYSAMNIAGPNSRDILAKVTDIDLSTEAFPYMGFREGDVAGVPARVSRVGFVSGLGYEIHPVADGTRQVWDALMEAGKGAGLAPFGVEAQRLLRLEMGHIIISRDTDALTHPYHAHLAWACKMDKEFFVSQRSLQILNEQELDRQLVGFVMDKDYQGPLPEDNHQIIANGDIAGRVTSMGKSPALGCPIGMAFIRPDMSEPGTKLKIRITDGTMLNGEVVELPFYKADTKA
jgi:sarcosine oxidase, subunit alpha